MVGSSSQSWNGNPTGVYVVDATTGKTQFTIEFTYPDLADTSFLDLEKLFYYVVSDQVFYIFDLRKKALNGTISFNNIGDIHFDVGGCVDQENHLMYLMTDPGNDIWVFNFHTHSLSATSWVAPAGYYAIECLPVPGKKNYLWVSLVSSSPANLSP